ncbi:MAG TPA: 16S rRNA (guanine(527)-N(7))-methyltransferase RsmG [Nocardioidaceae bacterium]|nr:16S rRNA (guanine(527)-N(7))-methyltransferase RsmG [Nocardioidaceae bacterium]
MFGDRLGGAVRFAELLADDGVTRGLIGPREVPRLWERHLLNCAVVADAFPDGATVCDVGSGAGLPGVVLAVLRPDLRITLLEPLQRRTTFLQEVVDVLGLEQVRVSRGRAEEQPQSAFDVVTARAVAPLGRLARWCLPLCRPGGTMLALKGARAAVELSEQEAELRRLRARSWRVQEYAAGGVSAVAIEVVAGEAVTRSTPPRRRSSR